MEEPGSPEYEDCLKYRGKYSYALGGKTKKNPPKKSNFLFNGNSKPNAAQYSAGGKYSSGGMLVGPSHDDGGIQAIVDGTEPIEVEGGEFVINKQTVDAVGEEFLHKLNSTETTHHTGGYNAGQLPSPSNFKDGGKINNGRTKMRRGGRRTTPKPIRKMGRGGPSGGGNNRSCQGRPQESCGAIPSCSWCGNRCVWDPLNNCGKKNRPGSTYQQGGRTRPKQFRKNGRGNRKYAAGGGIEMSVRRNRQHRGRGGVHSSPQKHCRLLTSANSCKNTKGCTWNVDHCF